MFARWRKSAPAGLVARPLLEELYARSGSARWDVTLETFAEALGVSVAHRFRESAPSAREVEGYVRSLHVQDLALACGCRAGHDGAWEHFVRELRPQLHAAARALGDRGVTGELADSLFGELYGLEIKDGERASLLAYYHGRARLGTWLRTVLAQRHVDARRRSARLVPLEDRGGADRESAAAFDETRDSSYVGHAQRALEEAVARLDPRERLRLRLYYGEDLTLAQIGRMLGEHEATVSRKLERARRTLRESIHRILQEEHGLSPAAAHECLEQAAGAPELDVSRVLARDER